MKKEIVLCIVAVIILAAVAVVVFIKRKEIADILKKEEVRDVIKEWIRKAENKYIGTKEGQERLAYVLGKVILLLPAKLQPFVKISILVDLIEFLFNEIAVQMPDGSRKAL